MSQPSSPSGHLIKRKQVVLPPLGKYVSTTPRPRDTSYNSLENSSQRGFNRSHDNLVMPRDIQHFKYASSRSSLAQYHDEAAARVRMARENSTFMFAPDNTPIQTADPARSSRVDPLTLPPLVETPTVEQPTMQYKHGVVERGIRQSQSYEDFVKMWSRENSKTRKGKPRGRNKALAEKCTCISPLLPIEQQGWLHACCKCGGFGGAHTDECPARPSSSLSHASSVSVVLICQRCGKPISIHQSGTHAPSSICGSNEGKTRGKGKSALVDYSSRDGSLYKANSRLSQDLGNLSMREDENNMSGKSWTQSLRADGSSSKDKTLNNGDKHLQGVQEQNQRDGTSATSSSNKGIWSLAEESADRSKHRGASNSKLKLCGAGVYPEGSRQAYMLALAEAEKSRRPPESWMYFSRITPAFVFSYFDYVPPKPSEMCRECDQSINDPNTGIRASGSNGQATIKKTPKVKEMKHIFGNLNVDDYFPGGKKNPFGE